MAALAVVLHRGSKVFWKVRCTVDVIIVNHGAHDVLEVVCFDPILSHEAARIYLRHSSLLKELSKEDSPIEPGSMNEDEIREQKKNLLVNFISERLQVKTYNPKTRLFQIEFVKHLFSDHSSDDGLDIECSRPFYLVPYVIQYASVVSNPALHHHKTTATTTASSPSNRSDTSFATLSMSRSRDEGVHSAHSREGNSVHSTHSAHSMHSTRTDNIYGVASISGSSDSNHPATEFSHTPANNATPHTSSHIPIYPHSHASTSNTTTHKSGISIDMGDGFGYISTSARNRLPFTRTHTNHTKSNTLTTTPNNTNTTNTTNSNHYPASATSSPAQSPSVTPRISPSTTPRTHAAQSQAQSQAPRSYSHARRRASMHIGTHIHAQQAAVAVASNATHHAVGSYHSTQHSVHSTHHSTHHYTIHTNSSHSPKGSHSQQSSFGAHDSSHGHTPHNTPSRDKLAYTTHPTNPPQHALTLTTHTTPFHLKMKPKFTHHITLYDRVCTSMSSLWEVMCSVRIRSVFGGSSAVHNEHNTTTTDTRKYSVNTNKDSSDMDSSLH